MKNAQFNANQNVTVHLTDHGIEVLRKKHEETNEFYRSRNPLIRRTEFNPPENGMLTTQLWYLMHMFGDSIFIGRENVFHLDITLHGVESQEAQQLKEEKEKWEHLFFLLKSDFEKLENYQTYEWKLYAIKNGLTIDRKAKGTE